MKNVKYKEICYFTTGSKRGYIRSKDRGVESNIVPVCGLDGLRGNVRRAMQFFIDKGATHYSVSWYQGVPSKGYSNQYCFAVYTGYVVQNA